MSETVVLNYKNEHVVYLVLNNVVADSRVIKTARVATDLGAEATVIGISTSPMRLKFKIHDVNVVLYPAELFKSIKNKLLKKQDILDDLVFVADDIKKLKPSLIHTHDMYGLVIGANILRLISLDFGVIPWVHDIHEYTAGITKADDESISFLVNLESEYIKEPDRLITVSPDLASLLIKDHHLTKDLEIIYNCPIFVDFKTNPPRTIKQALKIPESENLIVWVGRVNGFRGTHTIVEAVSRMPNVHLAILTNQKNQYTESLKLIAEQNNAGSRLHFHNYVDIHDVTSFIQDADLGVHAGTHEVINMQIALPNKLFEYIHAGLPVVVSDVPTMSTFVVNKKIGEVFESGNVESAVLKIKKVLENIGSYKKNINEDLKKSFSWESQAEKLKNIYSDLILNNSIADTGDPKIIHGFSGAAGQANVTSNALRKLGFNSDTLYLSKSKFNYNCDKAIKVKNEVDLNYVLHKVSKNYDVVHVYAKGIFFSWHDNLQNYIDLLVFKMTGKLVVFNFRGSEIRVHSIFEKINRFNYVNENPGGIIKKIPEEMQLKHLAFVRKFADVITVPDPELKTYVPDAIVVPRAVDLDSINFIGVSDSDVPLILHAPTQREIKGTQKILDVIDQLKSKGLKFNFELVEKMPHEQAISKYAKADIVIDQIRIGWYGVLAVECMALGKAVVSYIREDLIDTFDNPDLPIANANQDNLFNVLEALITNKSERVSLGKRARSYCEANHDAKIIARKYADIYVDLLHRRKRISLSDITNYLSSKSVSIPTRFELRNILKSFIFNKLVKPSKLAIKINKTDIKIFNDYKDKNLVTMLNNRKKEISLAALIRFSSRLKKSFIRYCLVKASFVKTFILQKLET